RLQQSLPEVDIEYWLRVGQRLNSSCARYPNPLELRLHNEIWQTFENGNVTFRLYAAYLDRRAAVRWSPGVLRVLATANQRYYRFPPTHCQLWYEGQREPIVVLISEYISIWPSHWGDNWPRLSYPHLLSCMLPEELPPQLKGIAPRSVSLTRRRCEQASNSLRVNYGRQQTHSSNEKLSFGVCLKAFDFQYEDISQRLIEWFELQRLLGASRIYAYMYAVLPAVQRVLDYYQSTGYLQLRPLTLADGVSLRQQRNHSEYFATRPMVKRLNELIPYNDCFYRNMHRHDYLLNVDLDEVIMPRAELRSWQQVVQAHAAATQAECPHGVSSLCTINSYFSVHPQAQVQQEQLYLLQHAWRSANFSAPGVATKCFHNARYSVTLHNHVTLLRLPGACPRHYLSTELAYLQHYRQSNVDNRTQLIEDRTAWKFAKQLRQQVQRVQAQLQQQSEESEYEEQEEEEEEELPQEQREAQAEQQ
ncbi:hypothetical protein KR222_011806, partial [Zaprionus bogoriensis]